MVQVSEAASTLLFDNLTRASVPPEAGYRLAMSRGDYRLRLDHPSDDDRVLRHEEHVIFMIDQALDKRLDDVILDVKEDDPEKLVLDRV